MASVTLQATTPGTAETGNTNITGTSIVGGGSASAPSIAVGSSSKGLYQVSTNDLGVAANGVEAFRVGPDTGGVPKQARFAGPVLQESNIDSNAGGVQEAVRINSKIASTASGSGPFAGLNITNDTDGSHVVKDAFYHALQVNVGTDSPSASNEVAAGAFFIFQNGSGSVFGLDVHPYAQPNADAFPPNMPVLSAGLHDNKKSGTNTGSHWGVLIVNSSNGRPVSGAGFARGYNSRRDTSQDYTTGTVSTNGTTTVTGSGTAWTSVGASPYVNLADKKILINGEVYTIVSVASATSMTVDRTVPTFSGAYRIRIAEHWTTDMLVEDSSNEGIRIQQDSNFPPLQSNKAFRIRDSSNSADVHSVDYTGATLVTVNNNTQIPLVVKAAGSQSASMQEWQDSGTVTKSRIGSGGALQTKESSRIAPWIEPEWVAANNTSISSTTATEIDSGTAKISFTPGCDLRVQVSACYDLQATSYNANSVFVGELNLVYSSTDHFQASQIIFNPGSATARATVSQVWNFTLTAGTAYTFKLTGKVNTSGSTYNVAATHTKMSLIAVGRF